MYTIRPYSPQDYQAVKKLLSESDMFDPLWDGEENLAVMVQTDRDSVLVAERDGAVIGSLYCVPFGTTVVYFFRLVVQSDHRNRGVATQLLTHAQTVWKKKGAKEVGFFVDGGNDHLQTFYKNRGYTTTKKLWVYMYKAVQNNRQ